MPWETRKPPDKYLKTIFLPLPVTTEKSNNIQDACHNTEV